MRNAIFKTLAMLIKGLRYLIGKAYMFVINKTVGVNKKAVVFSSFSGKFYSDNPRAISEKLHETHPEFEVIWLFNDAQLKKRIVPPYVKCIKNSFFKSMYTYATSKFWISNCGISNYRFKSKDQIYIQTWHGDRGFKKILYDYWTMLPSGRYKEGKLYETNHCDVMVTGSAFGEKKIRGAFGYEGEILKVGSPRNDALLNYNANQILLIKKSLGIDEHTRVLLYAPTFRNTDKLGDGLHKININLDEAIRVLEKKTNEKWICMIRAHSKNKGFEGKINHRKIIDASSYDDMKDLLLISDFFITDYSSSAGDYILRNKPLVLFQADKLEYMNNDRSFYFDIEESPFIVAYNQSELIEKIELMTDSLAIQNCQDIKRFYGIYETGQASEKIVDYILKRSIS